MRPLSAHTIVRLWEWGQGRNLAERALGLLVAALPDRSRDELAALTLGRRDALLLDLRERTFGPALASYSECPECGQGLEFTARVGDLIVTSEGAEIAENGETPDESEPGEFELISGDYALRFRLPDSTDLMSVAACEDARAARVMLARRCLLGVRREGERAAPPELPEQLMSDLAARMIECDPQAEVLLDLDCPACGHSWLVVFDIASFLWSEVSALAKRLLRDVHSLARAYGWSESDILSMSDVRRQFYLEMVT